MNGLGKLFVSICNGKSINSVLQTVKTTSTVIGKESPRVVSNTIMHSVPVNIRTKIIQKIPDPDLIRLKDSPAQFYTCMRDKIYGRIRGDGKKLIYQPRANYNSKEFHETLTRSENGFCGVISGAWFYRQPKNFNPNLSIVERLSLNVHQDKALIQKLDKYLSQNCPNARYKCPGAGSHSWNSRHESIVIYFYDKITPKVKQDIAKLAEPHVRYSDKAVMIGDKISDGVYSLLEPTKETLQPLMAKAKLMNLEKEFYDWLCDPDFYNGGGLCIIQNGHRVVKTSPATVEATRQMLRIIEYALK